MVREPDTSPGQVPISTAEDSPSVFPGMAVSWPGEARWRHVTPALGRLLGWPPSALEGRAWQDITHPDDVAVEQAHWERLRDGASEGYTLNKRFLDPEGGVRPARVHVARTGAAPGGLIITTVEDLIPRTALEHALRVSENRFRDLANNSSVLLWMSGLDGLCFYFNQVWLEFTGRTLEQEAGNGWAEGVHPDDLSACLDTYQEAFAARREFQMEYRLRHADGTYRWILDHGTPCFDDQGQFTGYIGSCLDITSQKAGEAALREANQRLERLADSLARANEELERFASIASHDLREPLRMIRCYLGLIQKRMGSSLSGEVGEYFAFAMNGARRMDRLIADLLLYSRVGRRSQEMLPVPLVDVVEESLVNLRVALDEANALVCVQKDLPVVLGLPGDLVRLFQNLIGNAVKYRAGDRPCEIRITSEEVGHGWVVSVQDNGMGIEARYHEKVFEIFQRFVPCDQYEGTGIGLAVCRKVMEVHGGQVSIQSVVGQGSSFRLFFPRGGVQIAA